LREKSNLLVLFRNLSDKSAGVQPVPMSEPVPMLEFQRFGYRLTPLVQLVEIPPGYSYGSNWVFIVIVCGYSEAFGKEKKSSTQI